VIDDLPLFQQNRLERGKEERAEEWRRRYSSDFCVEGKVECGNSTVRKEELIAYFQGKEGRVLKFSNLAVVLCRKGFRSFPDGRWFSPLPVKIDCFLKVLRDYPGEVLTEGEALEVIERAVAYCLSQTLPEELKLLLGRLKPAKLLWRRNYERKGRKG